MIEVWWRDGRQALLPLRPTSHEHFCSAGDHRWVCHNERCVAHYATPCPAHA